MKELLFLLVLFVSNVIQAITGFAGTVLAMPPSVYLLGLDHAKVVLNVMAWLSGLMIAVTGYRHINWKELLKMSAVMLVGMFAGIQICRIVKSENILLTIYGIIIVVVALKNLCIHTEKKLPDLILWIVLILAGIIHGMFVSGGALLVIYATQVLKEKEEFRATVAPVWCDPPKVSQFHWIESHAAESSNPSFQHATPARSFCRITFIFSFRDRSSSIQRN